eukprot:CAMPEP_0176129258 /NCGR_PEP_ID=MMETSP0120_2-20121206/65350_1 /TAXON_ID=160619 /ORGANISM="Kryptoperidinium foliaceum, Strain CCMP 1326" /LENGTH=41 /DNA_ID= /DNA_START= /DNA_END= /DNA_ORIENTATION=
MTDEMERSSLEDPGCSGPSWFANKSEAEMRQMPNDRRSASA